MSVDEWDPPEWVGDHRADLVVPHAATIDPLICVEWDRRLEAIASRRWFARWLVNPRAISERCNL